jgi:glutathione-regulated potassium-efflux system ancillary protein KefG
MAKHPLAAGRRPGYGSAAMPRVLILLVHPALHRSRANAALAAAVRGLPGVELRDLYAAYPRHLVDVAREQALLREHDAVVWQHPFQWYSAPSLLKEWQDVVLAQGFAYGPGGTALHGKRLLSAVTTGGPASAYRPGGHNRYAMRELLAPFDQTAHLCGMAYLEPFVVHGVGQMSDAELGDAARRYRERVEALRDGREPATTGGAA